MKTRDNNIQEHQNPTLPKILKEPGTGGTATIVDNRPATIYQRKLQETMHAHTASKANPIQRKVPKGSSRFQQIATAMGEKYGVDTSGLEATHNSSFPAQLNAEATIQAHKLHFAPGRDTDYNIRHEVAHAIDNTLHGTPKGDRIVNGQRIDTTREQVVDRMAKEPVMQRNSMSLSIQAETNSFYPDVYQLLALDTAIDDEKLNVIGETHSESRRRREVEEAFARSIFGGTDNMVYWREGQMGVQRDGRRIVGDHPLRSFHFKLHTVLHYVEKEDTENIERELGNLDKTLEEKVKEYLAPRDCGKENWDREDNLLDAISTLWNDEWPDSIENEEDEASVRQCKVRFRRLINNYLTSEGVLGSITLNVAGANSEETITRLQSHLGFRRSESMLDFVINHWGEGVGIWKVGDQHITDIQQIENNRGLTNRENYTLISKRRFNELLQAWRANRT